MRTRSLLAITLAVVLAGSWLSIVLFPSTQNFMSANTFWNGVRDFGRRFNADTSFSIDQLAPAAGRPAGTGISVLVIIPALPYREAELKLLADFVNSGGILLVMDDFGYGNQVLAGLGLGLQFAAVPLLDPYLNYRNGRFPVITDFAPGLQKAGIEQLILNHATALSFAGATDGFEYEILARSADLSFLDYNGNGARDGGDAMGPFAVAARTRVGSGTVIAVSDPSILINSMVGRADNEKFVAQLTAVPGDPSHREGRIALDASHLPKAPLDVSKEAWTSIRGRLAMPYSQVLLAAMIVMLSFIPVWNKRS